MNHRRWRWALLLAGGLAGCGSPAPTSAPAAFRLANLAPDSRPFQVLRDGAPITTLNAINSDLLSPGSATRRIETNPGPAVWSGVVPGGPTYFSQTVPSAAGTTYGLWLLGKVQPATGQAALHVVVATLNDAVPAGAAGLRVLQAAFDIGGLDLVFRPDATPAAEVSLGSALAYGDAAPVTGGVVGLTGVPATPGKIVIRATGQTTSLYEAVLTPTAGQVVQVAVTGTASQLSVVTW